MNSDYYYDDTVDNLLGTGKWSMTDVEGTIKRFKEAGYSAKSYYNAIDKGTKYEGRLWIKIVKGTVISVETTSDAVVGDDKTVRYFKNHVYYAHKYNGVFESLPSWLTEAYVIALTGRSDNEFKIVLGDDDWLLVQIDDVIVFDTVKSKFIVYDSEIEFNRAFISELTISENLIKQL